MYIYICHKINGNRIHERLSFEHLPLKVGHAKHEHNNYYAELYSILAVATTLAIDTIKQVYTNMQNCLHKLC